MEFPEKNNTLKTDAMRYKHLFWAIILISVGILFILNNLGIISFTWYTIWRLWPLIFILWGIAILPVRDIVKFTLLGGLMLVTALVISKLPDKSPWPLHFHHHGNSWNLDALDNDDESDTRNFKDQKLSVPFDSLAVKGILDLDAAAGNFNLSDTTADFLSFSKTGDIGNYELTSSDKAGTKDISLKLTDSHSSGTVKENKVVILLNSKPSWTLNFNIGAADMNLDLSRFRIDTATFDAGASSMDIRLGDLNPVSTLTFNAGASSIDIRIPKTAGCQVSSESFLVSKDFEGFSKKGDHIYQTANFSTSKSKIYITIKTAVSSIDISRY
jgi:hypothetical protein